MLKITGLNVYELIHCCCSTTFSCKYIFGSNVVKMCYVENVLCFIKPCEMHDSIEKQHIHPLKNTKTFYVCGVFLFQYSAQLS